MGECLYGKCNQVLVWINSVISVTSGSVLGDFFDGKCYQVLVWENSVIISVIRFWYGRILIK